MATNNQLIEGLYVSYFQRPADNPGMEFWGKAMATMSLDAVSAEFAKSTEYQGLVAGKTPEQVVDALYLNVLGRHAEAAALDFYGNALKNGAATVANVVGYITAGAQGSDRVAYADKMVAAELFSAALKVNSAYVLATPAAARRMPWGAPTLPASPTTRRWRWRCITWRARCPASAGRSSPWWARPRRCTTRCSLKAARALRVRGSPW